ncbi:MAG: BatD family protein [Muribaculaceae bacterium]
MLRLRYILALVTAVIAVGIAHAEATFKLIQPQNVVQGRRFQITYRLSNGEANPPSAPTLEGCTLRYGPSVSTMSSTQIINGQVSQSSSVDFTFIYTADTPGTVKVPALSVNCGGKKLTSGTASFQILPADKASAGGHGQPSAPSVQADDYTTQTPGKISPNDLFVRVSFSKSHVYEQEAVIATIKVYTKYDISSFLVTTQPAFEGFLSEELPVSFETQLENYNGQNYHTAVLKRCLLFPQKSGTLTVNSGKYDVTYVQYETVNMGFFRTAKPIERKMTTSSNAVTLRVEPLPQPAPAGFNGAVGKFTVETQLTPEQLRTNEAATYSYIVKGSGNIKYLKEPNIAFPSCIDKYTPKTDINANCSGSTATGTYRVDYTIVPQEVGKFTIPAEPFVYFNPETRQYVTLQTDAYNINVAKGANTSVVTEQKAIDTSMTDIRHIKPSPDSVGDDTSRIFFAAWYWLLWALATIALIVAIIAYRRHVKFNADVQGKRLARANREATKRLKAAHRHMAAHDNDKFYEALAAAIKGYIGDKLSIAPSQLIRDNITSELTRRNVDQATIEQAIAILDECEMARFTPAHSDQQVADIYGKAVATIKNIEDSIKRKG